MVSLESLGLTTIETAPISFHAICQHSNEGRKERLREGQVSLGSQMKAVQALGKHWPSEEVLLGLASVSKAISEQLILLTSSVIMLQISPAFDLPYGRHS